MSIAAMILAAGASTRMGRPKPLLPWGGSTLLQWEIDELIRSCVDDIVVVTGSRSEQVRRALGDAARYCVFNQRWPQGRATSLVVGATSLVGRGRAAPDIIVIQNVDQPTRADIVDRLVRELQATRAEVIQPSYRGKAGHPVVVTGALLPELLGAREETLGLRAVVEAHPAQYVAMDDEPVVRVDLDTPDLLDEARRFLLVPD